MINRIRVAVRIRPNGDSDTPAFSKKHEVSKLTSAVEKSQLLYDNSTLSLSHFKEAGRIEEHKFAFDGIYNPFTTQEEIFNDSKYLIDASLNGYNATIFAFGMTGDSIIF